MPTEPTFSQKIKRNAKITGASIVLFATFLAGGYVVPHIVDGYHKLTDVKPFVAPAPKLSEFDLAVQNYIQSEQGSNLCLSLAQAKVSKDFDGKYTEIYDTSTSKANAITMMINNGISPETAKTTVAIEKAQGRSK